MGSLTVAPALNTTHNAGNRYEMTGNITMSSSYATGGDSATALQLGIGLLETLTLDQPSGTGGGYVVAPVYAATPGYNATFKVQVFQQSAATGALTEVTSTTNLSTTTFKYRATGV